MNFEFALRNWALFAASVVGIAIVLFLLYRLFMDSARGQLLRTTRSLRECRLEAARAAAAVDRAERKLEKLRARADSVKPRHGAEAREALEDARALCKIADDQVLIAENHVRKVILEEFPPKRHAILRARYLPEQDDGNKPFTF